ncbi:hypothetical protein [Clostridium vincentii]|uniref:Uncharacterized protein n=1 Tax=Clostridium vincentii TaxID=52704 RepID=A0A2T0B5B6_9CLOT|nr:hypothetical protein [Clostridium vincentii]PRR79003.1 hypothetical protein CLVI_34130 [Clostridium vincentii]
MGKFTKVFKAFIYTLLEIIFVVVCKVILDSNKVDEIILLFEILIIFTLILCTLLIIDEIKKSRE